VLIFLTKNDELPDDKNWISVSLSSLETSWRNELDSPGVEPAAKMMLYAYLRMLRRHHMEDTHLSNLAARLWAKHPTH